MLGSFDASEDDEAPPRSSTSGTEQRTNRFVALVVLIVVCILIASSILYYRASHLTESTDVIEEVEPWERPFNLIEESQMLAQVNQQLQEMELGDITIINSESSEYEARLYRNNNWGIFYWEFEDGDTQIRVNAETGEIFDYFSTHETMEGPRIPEDEVQDYVERVMAQFEPLPVLMEEPQVDHSMYCLYSEVLDNGTIVYQEDYEDWDFCYNRTVDGILTSDGFWVWIEVDGTLINYGKEWFMDLDDLDIGFTVTREEAETAALESISSERGYGNLSLGESWQEIVWPKTMDGEHDVLGDPNPVWVVEVCGNVGSEGWSYYHRVLVRGQGNGEIMSILDYCG